MKSVGPNEFRQLARSRNTRGVGVMMPTAMVARSAAAGSRKVRWVLSDGSIDRAGDRIDPTGWDVTAFRQSPVVLFAHDALSPPIARAGNIASDGIKLSADIEFAGADVYAFADTIFRLVCGGYIRAGSVGFLPIEFAVSKDPSRPGGIDFKRQELLEFSIVPVPCNANALQEARAKGIDTRPLVRWAEAQLAAGGRVSVSRTALEDVRRGAREPKSPSRPVEARRRQVRRHRAELQRLAARQFLRRRRASTLDERRRKVMAYRSEAPRR